MSKWFSSVVGTKKFFIGVLVALCVIVLPFVGLGLYKIYDLAGSDALVICTVLFIALFILSVVFLFKNYTKSSEKEDNSNSEVQRLTALNKQMFSDILTLESQVTELENKIKELESNNKSKKSK